MHFFQSQKLMIATLFVILSTMTTSLFAQEYKYLGTEPNITHEALLQKASLIDFSTEAFQEVYKDNKNTYFTLSTKNLDNRMVKIKILELIARDHTLVNIGASPDSEYNLFLVNNSLEKTNEQILEIVHGYILESQNEVKLLTEEQQQQWLLENDKYANKK